MRSAAQSILQHSLIPLKNHWHTAGRRCRSAAPARQVATYTGDGLPVIHSPAFSAPVLPEGHRFPMGVFQRIHDLLLIDEVVKPWQIQVPTSLPGRCMLELAHDPDYLTAFCDGVLTKQDVKRIGFGDVVRTPVLIERTLTEIAGTLLAAELALDRGLAVSTAGGTHHAFAGHGSGFCILNDLALTALELQRRGDVTRVLILDLDVHQGDGTAAILAGHPNIMTVSFHAEKNFPTRKQKSDLDVALPDGMGDDDYLRELSSVLPRILAEFRPQLVLYDAGVDSHVDDELGRLSLTNGGLLRRDLQVIDTVLAAGVALAGVVGGGYSENLTTLARRHCCLHLSANEMWRDHAL